MYHPDEHPSKVTQILGREPTDTQVAGETWTRRAKTGKYPLSGWFLCSKDAVESYDSGKHLDWILSQLEPRLASIRSLLTEHGWRADLACLWDSESGHGGPTLSPAILRRLATVEIELWFDVYFHGTYFDIRNRKNFYAIQQNP
jgi:hypothetical protein